MQEKDYYASELAKMPYLWFLKENFLKTIKLKHVFIKNDNIDFILNIITFPISIFFLPIISFFVKQLIEGLSNQNKTIKVNYSPKSNKFDYGRSLKTL